MDSLAPPPITAVDAASSTEIKCCCGDSNCAYLERNSSVLDGLEKDLVSAAQIGQALLVRHEAHMAEAEAERIRMTSTIDGLELAKKDLEMANARAIEENRQLLDQLEDMNNLLSESDAQIQSLTSALHSTRQELQRVSTLASRAAALEKQLTDLEDEQARIQEELTNSQDGHKTALQRWRLAESTINHLQMQIDRIEKEGREERARHEEVLGRMERRKVVEKELESAAGRLKGAAAINHLSSQQTGSSVVSHFVKDILQDNANLQMGVVELREMLITSNAEVENLREQLLLHQPADDRERRPTLEDELFDSGFDTRQLSEQKQEVHVHHHYHAPDTIIVKRQHQRKKRPSLSITQPIASGSSTPRFKGRELRTGGSTSAAILSQTSASVPGHQSRWSIQSTRTASSVAASSVPSSPRRGSSIFDSVDSAIECSRLTTPTSSVPSSPTEQPKDMPLYRGSNNSQQRSQKTFSTPTTPAITEVPDDLDLSAEPDTPVESTKGKQVVTRPKFDELVSPTHETIHEEAEWQESADDESDPLAPHFMDVLAERPALRRAASHESLISVSGMDIHTLKSRPSQILNSQALLRSQSGQMAAPSSTAAAVSRMTAVMTPEMPARLNSSDYNRAILSQHNKTPQKATLGKMVGNWVWGKWGVAPAPTSLSPSPQRQLPPRKRTPGVNQMGPIEGLLPPKPAPINIEPRNVDANLLSESLIG